MSDSMEEKLLAALHSIKSRVLFEEEFDRQMHQLKNQEFSAIHKGVTVHVSGETFRVELSDQAYESGKEFLEEAIAKTIRQALDIRGAELERVTKRLSAQAKEFR